jgi:hypothetical protein
MRIRDAADSDLPVLARLLDDYMRETFARPWDGDEARLRQADCRIVVADDGALVGFAAWRATYDLHHCQRGGEVIDMYVIPARRARLVAVRLIAEVCVQIGEAGGRFVMGQSVDAPAAHHLYHRVARCFAGAHCYVSGRAFRALAELRDRPSREIVASIPPQKWSYEP